MSIDIDNVVVAGPRATRKGPVSYTYDLACEPSQQFIDYCEMRKAYKSYPKCDSKYIQFTLDKGMGYGHRVVVRVDMAISDTGSAESGPCPHADPCIRSIHFVDTKRRLTAAEWSEASSLAQTVVEAIWDVWHTLPTVLFHRSQKYSWCSDKFNHEYPNRAWE